MTWVLVLLSLGAAADEGPASIEVQNQKEQSEAASPAPPDAPAQSVEAKVGASLRLAQTLSSGIVLDELGTTQSPTHFETRLRLGPELKYGDWSFISEFDIASGALWGTPPSSMVASRVPTPPITAIELRQLFVQYRWGTGAARLGAQSSHIGLGMLNNSGAKDPEVGDFGLQHGGTVVLRAGVAARPLFSLGGAYRAVEPVVAFDWVVRDATANILAGDRALQGIVGLRFNVDDEHQFGLTGIYRNQRRDNGAPGERSTDAFVVDLFGKWTVLKTGDSSLALGGELAAITGTTTQSRSDAVPVLAVRQFGAVARVNYRAGAWGLLFDGGFASGDQNPYDGTLNNFRFSSDYKVGLIIFDEVLGYQTARSGWRAADPLMTAVPPEGVDLLPTAGAVSGAWYLFPRASYGIAPWLDVYGGPLFAFTSAQLTDPYNTRMNGGVPVNYLGAQPGNYLGTELDLGLSARASPTSYLRLSATLEGGVLVPGDAFRTASGGTMGVIGVGRLRLSASL